MNRKAVLFLSIVVSLALHALLLYYAPRVKMIQAHDEPPRVLERYRVDLRVSEPEPVPARQQQPEAPAPDSIEELLPEESEPVRELASLMDAPAPIPSLEERLAQEALEREFEFERDLAARQLADAKIIEISQETAREGIDIERRYVRPSPEDTTASADNPVLRAPMEEQLEEILAGDRPRSMFPGMGFLEPGVPEQGLEPDFEPDLLTPGPPSDMVARETTRMEQEARKSLQETIKQEAGYEFIDDMLDVELDTYLPPNDDPGYFRVRIMPKPDAETTVLPKDVIFVVDASKSIIQRKLTWTMRGLGDCLDMLHSGDRFNIVAFRETQSRFTEGWAGVSPGVKAQANSFLSGFQSMGGTDVYNGIRPVLDMPTRPGVPAMVLVITDGRPTTGVQDARAIINRLSEENAFRKSIYTFAGGKTANRYLLDLLAYRNKGISYVVDDMTAIDEQLPAFFRTLNEPILVDCQADFGEIDESMIYPRVLPDFYQGRAVTVYGRFPRQAPEEFFMRLTGRAESRQKEVIFKADLADAEVGDRQIARNWAFNKVYYLIGQITQEGETPELMAELQAVSRAYGIRTSYN